MRLKIVILLLLLSPLMALGMGSGSEEPIEPPAEQPIEQPIEQPPSESEETGNLDPSDKIEEPPPPQEVPQPTLKPINEIEEFDAGKGKWSFSPKLVGLKELGWISVINAREKALKTNTTSTKKTYYWKLFRTFDLANVDSPQLNLKYDFRGRNYEYFRITIGSETASKLADFTILNEDVVATGVHELAIDLKEYVGQKVKIQLLLKKSSVVETSVGLYVHRIGLITPGAFQNVTCDPFDRSQYQRWIDTSIIARLVRNKNLRWIDADKDCQDTRNEVLIEENVGELVFDEKGCNVLSGQWNDPYTGQSFTNPTDLDIDHMVPLKEVHQSGGWEWNEDKRKEYAEYLTNESHLIAVSASANRSKGAKDIAEWLPSNESYHKEYAKNWTKIKVDWGLSADSKELAVLKSLLENEADIVFPTEETEDACTD